MPSWTEETPQRRPRRRKVPKTTEKENASAASDTAKTKADTTSKPRSRKSRKDDLVLKENDDNITLDFSSNEDAALTRFQDASAATSSASYWKRYASLAECVVRASQSLCEKRTSSLLLEEHASELLSTCRTLVKEATEQKKSAETLTLLYVAIHGLRAICPVLTDSKKMEASMKILYHVVTTASDVCCKSKDLQACMDATSQCLAAFQALGSLLNGYKVQMEDNKSVLAFKWKASRTPSDLFPLLTLSSSGKASGGAMAVKQVYKIAMQAALSVANALAHVYTIQIRKSGKVSCVNDFGSYTGEIIRQTTSYETILRLAQEVTIPWTCFFSNELATKENVEDSLTYAKRVFRLLFDVASQIDKCISQSSSRKDELSAADSLRLRKQAILAYMLSTKDTKPSRKSHSAVKDQHWESACAYACKASVAYRQQLAKDKRVAHDECLDRFHKDVGRVLDSFATNHSLSYIEYSAYRALHSTCKVAEHGACDSPDCLFGQLGFRFHHSECCSARQTRDSSDSIAAAGHATLAVFFLVLVMQSELDLIISGKQSHDQSRATAFEEMRDGVIATFRSVFVEATQLPPYDVTSRCHKILEALSLNRKVYQILSAKETPERSSRATLTALETLGHVLSECIGPLAVSLLRSGEGENKERQQWELAADSYSRGLTVFERVREQRLRIEEPSSGDLSCRTDDALRGLFALCHESELASQLSEETLEKAAKVTTIEITAVELESPLRTLTIGLFA